MRKNQKRRGVSWIRMVLLIAALLMLGTMMYFLQQTAVMSEEGTATQKTTTTPTGNATQKVNTNPNKNQQLRATGMTGTEKDLAKQKESSQRKQAANSNNSIVNKRAMTGEQMLDIVKKADEKTLMKQQEAEAKKNAAEGGERPASLIEADRKKMQTRKGTPGATAAKQQSQSEAVKDLLYILEMFEKKNQTLVKKHKAPREFLLGLSEQTNALTKLANEARPDALCGELKAEAGKLQNAVEGNKEQAQFYRKELRKLDSVFEIYCR